MSEKHPSQSNKVGPMSPTCDPAPSHPQTIEVTRTYLDMAALAQLIPGAPPTVAAALERCGARVMALAGGGARETPDVGVGLVDAGLDGRGQRVMQLAETPEDRGRAADERQRGGEPRGEDDAEMDTDLTGQHDREPRHEERDGHDRHDQGPP